ncbi:MAG: phosphate ABC transporter permease subunit PstC [Candidatus Thiodiazotropha sp. (ex Dulcina madagascariensis)]|nr:phosphate ABC transporter permease subunit PstC [Candidatus Thiodiazotropha sp. (ex Dulcina madagascariensis)]
MTDRLLTWTLGAATLMVASLIAIIAAFLLNESLGMLNRVELGRFFTDSGWSPTMSRFNILPMIVASVLLMAGAVIVASPLAVLTAVFLRFYAPSPVIDIGRRIIEVLAAMPSVVYGLWGLVVLVPIIAAWQQPGASLMAGILVLSLMIFPTITIVVHSGLTAMPRRYIEASQALAMSRAYMVRQVVLPAVRASIAAGITLGAARAIGETMAVMMVTGNIVAVPGDLFDPVRALTSNIALEMAYALGDHRGALYISSLLLLAIVILLVLINEFIVSNKLEH